MTDDLASALEDAANRSPDCTAVVFNDARITYAELADRARRIAAGLSQAGVRAGDRVAFLAANRPEYLELWFGAASLGASLVPINTRFGVSDLRHAIRKARPSIIFFAPAFRSQNLAAILSDAIGCPLDDLAQRDRDLPELLKVVAFDPVPGVVSYREMQSDAKHAAHGDTIGERSPSSQRGDAIGLMLFTSGSSGAPKPVMLGQRELVTNMRNLVVRQRLSDSDIHLSFLPYFHIFGGVLSTLAPILSRGCIVMMEAFDATVSLELVQRERCTVVNSVAPCYQAWLEHPNFRDYDLSSVRTGICSAGKGPMSAMAKRVRKHLAPMHSIFCMTETCGAVTFTQAEESAELATESAGTAMPGFEVGIFERATDAPEPAGVEGEIRIRSDNLARGYFDMPEQTARSFGPDGWFRTGDRGRMDEKGYLWVLGRLDDRLRSGGENIDPGEVETFIESLPSVAKCYVVGVPDDRLHQIPVAFVILSDRDALISEDAIRAACRGQIANFKIPRRVFFIDEAPGWLHKVQRHSLQLDAIRRMAIDEGG